MCLCDCFFACQVIRNNKRNRTRCNLGNNHNINISVIQSKTIISQISQILYQIALKVSTTVQILVASDLCMTCILKTIFFIFYFLWSAIYNSLGLKKF